MGGAPDYLIADDDGPEILVTLLMPRAIYSHVDWTTAAAEDTKEAHYGEESTSLLRLVAAEQCSLLPVKA